MTAALNAAKPQLDATRVQVEKVNASLTAVVAKLKMQPEIIAKHAASVKQLMAAVPAMEIQVAAAKKTMDTAVAGLAPMQAATAAAQKALVEQTPVLEGSVSELVAFEQQGHKLTAELEAATAAATVKREALKPVQASVTSVANTVSSREGQIKQMAEAMAKLQADLAGLNQAQTADQGKLDESRSQLQDLEAAAEAAEDAAQETKEKAEFFRSVYGA